MEFDLTINNSTSWSDPKYDFYQVTHTGDVKVRLDLFCTGRRTIVQQATCSASLLVHTRLCGTTFGQELKPLVFGIRLNANCTEQIQIKSLLASLFELALSLSPIPPKAGAPPM